MEATIERAKTGKLLITISAQNELESIALERWSEENRESCLAGHFQGLLTIATPVE